MAAKLNVTQRNKIVDTCIYQNQDITNGTLKLYTGTQPATGGGSHSDTLLVTIALSGRTGVAANGSMTLFDITATAIIANGTVGWGRLEDTNTGANKVDFSVTSTGGGGDLEVDNTTFTTSDTIDMSSIKIAIPES